MDVLPQLVGWHEVAIGVISVLLTIAGWMWTMTVKTVLALRKELTAHVVQDATSFGDVKTLIAEKQVELLKEIQNRRPTKRK